MGKSNLAEKEYVSNSTVDRPPHDPEEDQDRENEGQQNLFETEDDLMALNSEPHERKWKVNLQLTLTADDGKPSRVCMVGGMARGRVVLLLLKAALESRRNMKIIEAILDNPTEEIGEDVF